jgi:hypothetical protein
MRKVTTDPDEFIQSLPDGVKKDIKTLDKAISTALAGETRVLWQGIFWGGSEQNIIGYGDFVYERPRGNVEWFIVGLGPQKNYISVYINAVEGKQYLVEKYAGKLGKAKVGKSSISFKKLEDINLDQLIGLVKKAKELMRQ